MSRDLATPAPTRSAGLGSDPAIGLCPDRARTPRCQIAIVSREQPIDRAPLPAAQLGLEARHDRPDDGTVGHPQAQGPRVAE
jgi:hypothetical protein